MLVQQQPKIVVVDWIASAVIAWLQMRFVRVLFVYVTITSFVIFVPVVKYRINFCLSAVTCYSDIANILVKIICNF